MSTVHTFLPKKLTSTLINDAFWPLQRACMRTGLNRELDECIEVISRNERAHRRLGARVTRGQAKYRLSVGDTARFWVLRALEEIDLNMSADTFSILNERWAMVAKLKFAAERTRVRHAESEDADRWDTMKLFREYYNKSIGVDIAPIHWNLMLTELNVDATDLPAISIALRKPPYMGIDYARDIAVRG